MTPNDAGRSPRTGHEQPITRGANPAIQALGITQHWSPTRWNATGDVEGVGWLEAWGTSLLEAMEALQALAARCMAEHAQEDPAC